jgi:hypothetical protein
MPSHTGRDVINEVRNELFNEVIPGVGGGQDLISLDLERARVNGIGSYNDLRMAYGLDPVRLPGAQGETSPPTKSRGETKEQAARVGLALVRRLLGTRGPGLVPRARTHSPCVNRPAILSFGQAQNI